MEAGCSIALTKAPSALVVMSRRKHVSMDNIWPGIMLEPAAAPAYGYSSDPALDAGTATLGSASVGNAEGMNAGVPGASCWIQRVGRLPRNCIDCAMST